MERLTRRGWFKGTLATLTSASLANANHVTNLSSGGIKLALVLQPGPDGRYILA
jgi:hypothetical protein